MMADEEPRSFSYVFEKEKEEIKRAREQRGVPDEAPLVGLALSGGGIRSATFNLGILQGLARFNFLRRVDYLSTVSGGGYIGSWLVSWIYRAGKRSTSKGKPAGEEETSPAERPPDCLEGVRRGLTPEWYDDAKKEKTHEEEPPEIDFLREYSNYLTPRRGWLSPDSLTVASAYFRNVFLNLLVLVPALLGILLLPRLKVFCYQWVEGVPEWLDGVFFAAIVLLVAGYLLLLKGVVLPKDRQKLGWHRLGHLVLMTVIAALVYVIGWAMPDLRDRLSDGIKAVPASSGDVLLLILAFVPLLLGARVMVRNLDSLFAQEEARKRGSPDPVLGETGKHRRGEDDTAAVRWKVVLPVLASAWVLSLWLWRLGQALEPANFWRAEPFWDLRNPLLLVFLSGVADFLLVGWAVTQRPRRQGEEGERGTRARVTRILKRRELRLFLYWAFFAGLFGGALFMGLAQWLGTWESDGKYLYVATFGMPLVALVYMLTASLHVGLVGQGFSQEAREWWSRLGGVVIRWTLLIGGAWLLAIAGPYIVGRLLLRSEQLVNWLGATFTLPLQGWGEVLLAVLWLVVSLAGLLAGREAALRVTKPRLALRILTGTGPVVFMAGFLLILAYTAESLVEAVSPTEIFPPTLHGSVMLFLCVLGLLGLASWLSLRFGINEFSMHDFYRNRLVRTYLGATTYLESPGGWRDAHPFTGFTWRDDSIDLSELCSPPESETKKGYCGPYPILNAALNLSSGKRLARQERRADSFVFTPLYSGYNYAPRKTGREEKEQAERQRKNLEASAYRDSALCGGGIRLGTALAISGAATTPAMGHFTKGPLAFLMTVFNIRLGWWSGNPRHKEAWRAQGPRFGLKYLIKELMGWTDDQGKYVYLSDGGHFENLGIYELVRRRCRLIVACDASQDREMKFKGLAGAIQKCRTDFGVNIEINVEALRRQKDSRYSRWHCAVGDIRYDHVDIDAKKGTLLYLKTSLTGDEPADVLRYADERKEFPHQSTADQFFNETQFESYRALGQHIIQAALEKVARRDVVFSQSTEEVVRRLDSLWRPRDENGDRPGNP